MGLGLLGGGVGVVKFLAKEGAKITVTDLRSKNSLKSSLQELAELKNIRYVLGQHYARDLRRTDLIVKNPGVKPNSPFLLLARKKDIPIVSDIGIFFRRCPARIIGVTGTRGKSTAAYLIWKFLKTKFRRVHLAGNIQKSVLEILPRIKKDDLVILELSSFQLHDLISEKVSPSIAVITNIFKDHLNWHKDFRDYIGAKSQIFGSQKPTDFLFLDRAEKTVRKFYKKARSKVTLSTLSRDWTQIVDRNVGQHYRGAAGLAVAVAKHFGVRNLQIKKILKNFKGLPGRQEEIAKINGIYFINDTTSTMPEATVAALDRFFLKAFHRKIVLIAGGADKNLDFKNLAKVIKKKTGGLILLPGTATEKLKKGLVYQNFGNKIRKANSMIGAVKFAYGLAQKGDWIILSPGAASFGLFLNEFDRGRKFIEAVKALK